MKQVKMLQCIVLSTAIFFAFVFSTIYAKAQPTIGSLSAVSGIPGSSVIITGTNFSSTASNDVVFFGAAQATVSSASTTSLTVTVPQGATYGPVSVLNTATTLTAFSQKQFFTTYSNAAYAPATVNFDARIDSVAGNFPNAVTLGDLDGDGKPDVIGADFSDASIYIFRNTSSSGTIAFAAKDTLHGRTGPFRLSVADIDGDGKPDIVVPNRTANVLTLYMNTSTPGSISFATAVTLATAAQPNAVAIADIDGDGKPDIVVANQSGHSFSIFQNNGTPGTFSFAARVNFALPSDGYQVAVGDIDGDSKPDIAVSDGFGADSVCIFRNTSTPGTISLASRQDFSTPSQPLYVGLNDLDGDGKADMVTVNLGANNMSVFQNTSSPGSISFATRADIAAGSAPGDYSVADIDGDGKPDICLADGVSNNVSIYLNTSGSGTISFAARVNFAALSDIAAIASGDIDGDGKADVIATAQTSGKVSFFRNNPLHPVAGATSVCVGGTTTLSNATPGGTWYSSNTAVATVGSTGVVTGVSAGAATISYAGAAGVSFAGNMATSLVTVNALPTLTSVSASPNPLCTGSALTLSAAGTSGSPAYNWTGPNGFTSTAVSPSFSASVTAASGVYSLTVTNAATGCSSARKTTGNVTVNALPAISAVSVSPVLVCTGSNVTLTASGVTGTGSPAYRWTGPNGYNSTLASPVFSATTTASTGIYSLSVSYPGTGCTSNAATSPAVTVNAFPSLAGVTAAPGTVCAGATPVTLSAASLTGTGTPVYSWTGPNGFSSTTASPVFTPSTTAASGSYSLTVTYPGAGCSTTPFSAPLAVSPIPAIGGVSAAPGSLCQGSVITLSATSVTGATSYQWSGPNGFSSTSSSPVLTATTTAAAGVYSLTVTSAAACTSPVAATGTVTVNPLPAIGTGGGSAICTGATASLSASGGLTYSWSPSTGLSATTGAGVSASPATTTTYSVTGTDGNGCTSASTATITVNALPSAVTVSGSGTFCNSSTIIASGGSGGTIYYEGTASGGTSTGLAASSQVVSSSGAYYFRARSSAGCWGSQGSTAVTVNPLPAPYPVTGGGLVCSGSSGVAVGLSATDAGISYHLFRGVTPLSVVAGTGSLISFGLQSGAGSYTVIATNASTGCSASMPGSATITVSPAAAPYAVTVTGGGGYCSGGTGVNIGIAGSAVGTNYQLYRGTVPIGSPAPGIGAALSFGLQTVAGTYTATAFNPANGCANTMAGTATVYVYTVPATYTVTGGGSFCSGGAGVHIGLGGSSTGVSYKLFRGGTPVGSPVAGTGASIDFGPFTAGGSYTVTGTSSVYGCVTAMDSSANVTVNPLPVMSGYSYSLPVSSSITLSASPTGGTWTSATPSVASAGSVSGVVTGIATGTDIVSYTLPTGCAGTNLIKVIPGSTGRRETPAGQDQLPGVSSNNTINILPNPNNGTFTISGTLGQPDDQEVDMAVTNMAGQVVYSDKIMTTGGTVNKELKLNAGLPNGLYMLTLQGAGERKVLRLAVNR